MNMEKLTHKTTPLCLPNGAIPLDNLWVNTGCDRGRPMALESENQTLDLRVTRTLDLSVLKTAVPLVAAVAVPLPLPHHPLL